jgi:hypothetical protein
VTFFLKTLSLVTYFWSKGKEGKETGFGVRLDFKPAEEANTITRLTFKCSQAD